MKLVQKYLAVAAIAASALTVSVSASAATVIDAFTSPGGGTFDLANSVGTIYPAFTATKGTTYDFTFKLDQEVSVLSQLQGSTHAGVSLPLAFTLESYTGATPLSAGSVNTAIATSVFQTGPSLTETLKPGTYFLQIPGSEVAKSELLSGALYLSAVPEPATWAMMLVGFGGLGASIRSNRRKQAAVAA